MTPLTHLLGNLTISELQHFIHQASTQKTERTIDLYGSLLTDIIGVEAISKLPEKTPEELNLHTLALRYTNEGETFQLSSEENYPKNQIRPHHLHQPVVRGVLESNRPFIALKLKVQRSLPSGLLETSKVVELVMKRYSNTKDGKRGGPHENNYVTSLWCTDDTGRNHNSYLYQSGGMSANHIGVVKNLIEGKTARSPIDPNVFLELAD